MAADAQEELRTVFDSFPGIATAKREARGSHVHMHGDGVVLAVVLENNGSGRTAALTVDFILSRMGAGQRLDGRMPVKENAGLACRCATPGARFYRCSHQQAAVFARALRYASARPMGPARPAAALSCTPLSVLLSHAFAAFDRDYRHALAGDPSKPSLGVWCNALRVIDDEGLRQRDLSESTVLSRRGTRAVVRDLERLRWLDVEKTGRGSSLLRLTAAGQRARDTGRQLVDAVEKDWRRRFGEHPVDALGAALAALANQFEIELPWYLTGYGPSDSSLTGGDHVAEKLGPPRIPAHGQDWPAVVRDTQKDAAELPLPALLSQVLAAFTIDYERDIRGYGAGLGFTSNFLQFVGDEGTTLEQASALAGIVGNGKSALERHLVVVVAPGRARDGNRQVYPTPKARRARDSHPHRIMEIEGNWLARYGAYCVTRLRETLTSMDRGFGTDLPNYPDTTSWFFHSMNAGSAATRPRTSTC